MFILYLPIKFDIPSSDGSLVITIKWQMEGYTTISPSCHTVLHSGKTQTAFPYG